jgi:hypothetical protein
MGMLAGFIFLVLLVGLASGPLIWRLRQDRREARAEAIQADANRALFDALGGESFVAVRVQTPSFWGPGRVVLSTPSDWQWLLAPAWSAVVAHVPADYELIVKPAGPAALPLESDNVALRRAA